MLPIVEEHICDWYIRWLGLGLFIWKPGVFGLDHGFSYDKEEFSFSTPWFLLFFPHWLHSWLYRNEVKDA